MPSSGRTKGRGNNPYASRLEGLRRGVTSLGLDGVIIAPGPNLRYLTGVNSQLLERPFLFFVPADGEPRLVAPRLESGPYKESPIEIQVYEWNDDEGPAAAFAALKLALRLRGRWGCEGRVPYGYLANLMDDSGLQLRTSDEILQSLREVKDSEEIGRTKSAADILADSFNKLPDILAVGMTEKELGAALREEIYKKGGEMVEFCLVQAGENAANPHWSGGGRRIGRDESIIVDAGCTYEGYNADITRTFVLGTNERIRRTYEDVRMAHDNAIRECAPGKPVGRVDEAARGYLRTKGLDEFFFHRTGHGLGLEVHEAPYIVRNGTEKLREGMVFTIEPGVYVSGEYGVRIEDNVITSSEGCEVVTARVPSDFGWWE